jgi:hypothetical protein
MVRRSSSIVPGRVALDLDGRRHIEIEAGAPGSGRPTGRIQRCSRVAGTDLQVMTQTRRRCSCSPNTSTELYDEWEDDLGVPLAAPLFPLRWNGSAE